MTQLTTGLPSPRPMATAGQIALVLVREQLAAVAAAGPAVVGMVSQASVFGIASRAATLGWIAGARLMVV